MELDTLLNNIQKLYKNSICVHKISEILKNLGLNSLKFACLY